MSKFKLHRPSPAMVVGIIACVLALTGGAIAAKKKIKTAPKNSVVTKSIKNSAVKKSKLETGERSEGFQSKVGSEIDLPAGVETIVASLSLPAGGKYLIIGETTLGFNATSATPCQLKDDGTVVQQGDALINGAANYTHTVTLSGFSDGGTVTLTCNSAGAAKAKNRAIDAIRVGSLTG